MQPWQTLANATTPDGAPLQLVRRGDEYVIRVRGQLLMSSRQHGSEERLAAVACDRLADATAPAVLVGGLGLGYSLRATLDRLPASARVVVAELVPAIVEWNRDVLADLAGRPLEDPRTQVVVGDVRAVIGSAHAVFEAILLDVDNGPAALTATRNEKLYALDGLRAAHRALKPGGVLVVWSAAEDPRFVKRLGEAGFDVRLEKVDARGGRGGRTHVLFVGQRR